MASAAPVSAATVVISSTERRRGVLEVLGAAILFGTTGTSARFAPTGATPLGIGAARLVIGGLALLVAVPLLGGRRRAALALWRTRWGLLGGLTTAGYQLCFFAATQQAGVAVATLIDIGSGPVIVGLLEWLLWRSRPAAAWWLATAICVAGLGLLGADGLAQPGVSAAGVLLALGAGASYAAYALAAKALLNRGAPSAEVMAAEFSLGGLFMLPVLAVAGGAWLAQPAGLAVALWLGLGATAAAYLLFGRGLRVLEAGPVATLVLAEPLVATLLGVLVLGERLAPPAIAGATLIAAGLAIQGVASTRAQRHQPAVVADAPPA